MHELGQEWILHTTPFRLKETTIPSGGEIVANVAQLYAKDKSGVATLYWMSDAGTEYDCSSIGAAAVITVGTTVATSGTAGSVLFVGTGPVIQQDNANLFWDDTANRLCLGSAGSGHVTGSLLSLENSGSGDTILEVNNHVAGSSNAIRFRGSRGTHASPSIIDAADTIAVLTAAGYDGSAYIFNAGILFAMDGTPGANDMPGKIDFYTCPDGSATALLRMQLDAAGNQILGTKAALATNATAGFTYVPSCAGVPTGTPGAVTGKIAVVADSTNNKLYIYSGGAWVALN